MKNSGRKGGRDREKYIEKKNNYIQQEVKIRFHYLKGIRDGFTS